MSVVTTVLLNVGVGDEALPSVAGALLAAGFGELGDLTESFSDPPERERRWGGNKYPEARLFGAAYNHLDLPRFMEVLSTVAWEYPEAVQLFVQEQEAFHCRVFELESGEWKELRKSSAAP